MIPEWLWFGAAIAMTAGPGAFCAVYARPFWRNRRDSIAQNIMSLAASLFVFGLASMLIRLGLIPQGTGRPLLLVANYSVAIIIGWRALQVWRITHEDRDGSD